MSPRHYVKTVAALTLFSFALTPQDCAAFIIGEENTWLRTASGNRTRDGQAGTLTWSIVPDGTNVVDGFSSLGPSNLNAFLTNNFTGRTSGLDLIEQALGRWDELSGLTFAFEPNDDGGNHMNRAGVLGVRGDIRLAGATIDGPSNTLAFNYFPSVGGDMVWDTSDVADFSNPSNNHRFLRNVVTHEIGHALGLSHVNSNSDRLLLEPFIDTRFDGPQLDEVRAIQFYFGDAFEEDNNGAGNGTIARASDLGSLLVGSPIVIGEDADVPGQAISPTATDFVSISNDDDLDVYSFTVEEFSTLDAVLTPLGGTFNQSGEGGNPTPFNADARSDLSFTLFDSDGATVLDAGNSTGAGESETITSVALDPGTYYTRIEGAEDTIQLYMLELQLELAAVTELAGDFNRDGSVDTADFTLWRDLLAQDVPVGTLADGNGNGIVDGSDYQIWVDNFGNSTDTAAAFSSVPEPAGGQLLLFFSLALGAAIRRRLKA